MFGPLILILFCGVVILTLLLAGQYLYKKSPKSALTVWLLSVLLGILFIYEYNTKNSRLGDSEIDNYVGIYKIDIYNSTYDSLDLQNYYDLILKVYKNKKFQFSYKTPFFKDTFGFWQPMSDGDISWVEISVGDKNLSETNIETKKWKFSGRDLTNGKNNNNIVFVRE